MFEFKLENGLCEPNQAVSRLLLPGAREAPHASRLSAREQLSRLSGTKTSSEVLEDQIAINE